MYKDQTSGRRDLQALSKFVADMRAARPQAWKRVECLKLACALEAVSFPMLPCDLDDRSLARTVQEVRSELGRSFDSPVGHVAVFANVWLQSRVPVDLLVSDASSVLAAASTDRFVAEG